LNEPFEVLLVDNGSVDGSVQYVRETFPKVKIIELGRNYGFAEGNNLAVKHAVGDYLVFVNNDTKAENEWLKTLVQVADTHPEFQILCSMQLPIPHKKDNRIYTLDAFGNVTIVPWESSFAVTDSMFARGGFFLTSRKWIENLGYLFDPSYFAYAEDVDLSLRTVLLGGRIGYVRDSWIEHYYQAGWDFPSFRIMYLNTRNLLLTYYKLFTPSGFRRFFLSLGVIYTTYSIFMFVFNPSKWRRRIGGVLGMVAGVFSSLHDFGRYRNYRKQFLKRRVRDDEYVFRRLFVKGKAGRLLKRMIFSA
jgi:GT2 family glycosyltransferase